MKFNYANPYPMARLPVFARNAVSTSHPLAAQAGLRMLWAGGSAVDAAIAAAATIMITEPVSNGLGSDAFAILWDGKELQGLNASGTAPAAWTPEYFQRKYGDGCMTPPKRGMDSVTVPGAIAGWVALHERYGKLPFEDLLQPAIEVAERGYLMPIVVQSKWLAATGFSPVLPSRFYLGAGRPKWANCFASQRRRVPCVPLPKPKARPFIRAKWPRRWKNSLTPTAAL